MERVGKVLKRSLHWGVAVAAGAGAVAGAAPRWPPPSSCAGCIIAAARGTLAERAPDDGDGRRGRLLSASESDEMMAREACAAEREARVGLGLGIKLMMGDGRGRGEGGGAGSEPAACVVLRGGARPRTPYPLTLT